MAITISGKTINDLTVKMMKSVLKDGTKSKSRNGDATKLHQVHYVLENPRERYLSLQGRKSNIFQLMAETLWLMAGSNRVDGYLEYFIKRAKEYSDDGIHWRGGYPERLVRFDQLQDVLDKFKKDGIHTRRAVFSIHMPDLDTYEGLETNYGLTFTKDQPCNLMGIFFVDDDKNFHLQIINRSNDIVFGSSINIFEFSFLHELMYYMVREQIDDTDDLKLGTYSSFSTNLHIYDFTANQAQEVIKSKQKIKETEYMHAIHLGDLAEKNMSEVHEFFQMLVQILEEFIVKGMPHRDQSWNNLKTLFYQYNMPKTCNTLYAYAGIVFDYIESKHRKEADMPPNLVYLNKLTCNDNLIYAVEKSAFRKFKTEVQG
jgi:thymidylate synthase